jgi:hypothetical protein
MTLHSLYPTAVVETGSLILHEDPGQLRIKFKGLYLQVTGKTETDLKFLSYLVVSTTNVLQ